MSWTKQKSPSYLLHIIVKSSHCKIWNILVLAQTLWILMHRGRNIKS